MQALALDPTGQVVHAHMADKKKNYRCIACQAIVRRRGGDWVRDHFYHLQDLSSCHLAQKSETHLNLQIELQNSLPAHEAFLEERFTMIQRIADVAWYRYKIVFEIQVSPLSFEEMLGRIDDYKKIGWQVVWILHARSFFGKRASREELLLLPHPHYFANHDAQGKGEFFDVLWHGPYPPQVTLGVELWHPLPKTKIGFRDRWPYYFKGDFIDKALQGTFSPPKIQHQRLSIRKLLWSAHHYLLENIFDQ